MKQEATVDREETHYGKLLYLEVRFFRDDVFQFDIRCRSESDANLIATYWRQGAKQWQIAEMLKKMGIM